MTTVCVPGGCRTLQYPRWYQLYSSKNVSISHQLSWVGWLFSDPMGVRAIDADHGAGVTVFTQAGFKVTGVDYRGFDYPLGPRYTNPSWEGSRQWFKLASWPFRMQASWTRQMDAVGWLWSTPYKVKSFLVGKGDYVVFYADGREISFMEAIS